jgi:hypothetical protein
MLFSNVLGTHNVHTVDKVRVGRGGGGGGGVREIQLENLKG